MIQYPPSVWGAPFPSLHLWPVQDTFVMKMVHLPEGQKIKIGRQTNNKTIPGERNAYFDSKVLSRLHAEIWEQNGKIYIRDVKSSNGTFINGQRLSPEGVESEPYELNSEDIVEFGIDIVSEDNRTIVHHKVASKVYCVFNPDDAAISARESARYQNQNKRDPPQPQVISAGGKANGLSFDHVLQKLQAELQKSKETGDELQNLTGSMTDIQDTLSGGLPPAQNGTASQFIPPQYQSVLASPHGQQAAAVITLQNQLADTQKSLQSHLEKIRQLESQLQSQSVHAELAQMREQMEQTKRDVDLLMAPDVDAKSVATLMDSDDAEERVRERRKTEREPELITELTNRITSLSAEVAEAVQLSSSLKTQHVETVDALTKRIEQLESGFAGVIAEEMKKAERKWNVWRVTIEEEWRKERETWESERERLRGVVRDWEEASRRAHEEEEERQLNERLSDEDNDQDVLDIPPRKPRRRRSSTRAVLAVQALKDAAEGTSTPKPIPQALEPPLRTARPRTNAKAKSLSRSGSASTFKEESEDGSHSGDTVKDDGERARMAQPIPIFTVIVVAAIAGVLYYRTKD